MVDANGGRNCREVGRRGGAQELAEKEKELLAEIMRPEHVLHYLVPGRLLRVRQGKLDWGWGILVGVQRLPSRPLGPQEAGALVSPPNPTANYLADVLLPCSRSLSPTSQGLTSPLVPARLSPHGLLAARVC